MILPDSIRILGPLNQKISRKHLTNGEHVRANVLRATGDASYVLRIKGLLYQVRSEIALKLGGELMLRVVRTGDSIRLVRELPLNQTAQRVAAFSDNFASQSAIDALVRSGMPVLPESIHTISRALDRHGRYDSFFTRLIALIIDKNLDPTESFVNDLLAVFDHESGPSPERGDSSEENAAFTQERRSDGQEEDHSQDRDGGFDVESEFCQSLRRQGEAGEVGRNAICLFNHAGAEHDMWQIVPYRVRKNDWNASGAVKIRLGKDGVPRGFVLEVREGNEVCRFHVRRSGKRFVAHLPSREGESVSAREVLVEKLRNLDIDIDDINSDETFDGFSAERTDIGGSVDAFV